MDIEEEKLKKFLGLFKISATNIYSVRSEALKTVCQFNNFIYQNIFIHSNMKTQ